MKNNRGDALSTIATTYNILHYYLFPNFLPPQFFISLYFGILAVKKGKYDSYPFFTPTRKKKRKIAPIIHKKNR